MFLQKKLTKGNSVNNNQRINCDYIMKILIIGSFRWEMYAPAFYHAMVELGHDVKKIDYDKYHFKNINLFTSFFNRLQDRFHVGFFIRKYNKDIINEVKGFKPDFVFLYRCYNIWGHTTSVISQHSVVFSYNNDDPFSGVPSHYFYRYYKKNAQCCNINYVYRKKNIEDYSKIGINNTRLLLPYYLASKNRQINCHKDIPLAFLGHFEEDGRDRYIYNLKKAGIPIIVFGDEKWKEAPLYEYIKDVIFPAKRGAEYNETINRCQVCLVFFSKLNNDTYTRRCFEIPVTKTVMLCEYTDDMNSMFPEGDCAVYFQNQDELVEKAKELMKNEKMRNDIAQNAYAKLQSLGGSEFDRCCQIIEDWKSLCQSK